MLTRINTKKVYGNGMEAQKAILDAISGDWGGESLNGLRVVRLGRVMVLQGVYGEKVEAVDIPVTEARFAAYFHDTIGNVNMVIVEAGAKFVSRPENIKGGFAFFAIA